MSESVHHDEQHSSLHCRKCFRYDEQRSSFHTEGLIIPVSSTCFGQLFSPKHVELTGIIIKPLLLHLVGCLYYL